MPRIGLSFTAHYTSTCVSTCIVACGAAVSTVSFLIYEFLSLCVLMSYCTFCKEVVWRIEYILFTRLLRSINDAAPMHTSCLYGMHRTYHIRLLLEMINNVVV